MGATARVARGRGPAGTTWNEAEQAVELEDGTLVRPGDSVSGGGGTAGGREDVGFTDGEAARALDRCRVGGEEVFFFNSGEDLVVTRE